MKTRAFVIGSYSAGVGCIAWGAGAIYPPALLIVLGVGLIVAAVANAK